MDSHAHLDFFPAEQQKRCIEEALAAGVNHFVVPGVSREKWLNLKALTHYENVFFALGEHPLELAENSAGESRGEILFRAVERERAVPSGGKLVAIGEIGLDYFHLPNGAQEQRQEQLLAFFEQLQTAKRTNLPVLVHCRDAAGSMDAWVDARKTLEEVGISPDRVVFHSFPYGPKQAQDWCSQGGFVSISGLATRPSTGEIREAIPLIPPTQMLLETDAPFLLPHALRSKSKGHVDNEPKNVVEVARLVGEILEKPMEAILAQTLENGLAFFRIGRK
jgi:TatD DNase family protein